MKGLSWKKIIMSPSPVLTINEALSSGIPNRVPKRTIVVRTGNKPYFDNQCILAHCAKQWTYRVWSRSKMRVDFEGYRVTRRHAHHMCEEAEQAFNERNKTLLTCACTRAPEVVNYS